MTKLLSGFLMTVFFSSCDKENKTEDVNLLTSYTWSIIDQRDGGFEDEGFEFGESKVGCIFKFFHASLDEPPANVAVFHKDMYDYKLEGNVVTMYIEGEAFKGVIENNKLFMDFSDDGSRIYEFTPMKWNQLMRNNWINEVRDGVFYELSFCENTVGLVHGKGDSFSSKFGTYKLKGRDIYIDFDGIEEKGSIMNDNTVVFDGLKYKVQP